MARPKIEWVAQVSFLRPGCFGQELFEGKTQVSKARPGPPTQFASYSAAKVDVSCGPSPSQIRPRKRPGLSILSGSNRRLISLITGKLSGNVPQQSNLVSAGCLR